MKDISGTVASTGVSQVLYNSGGMPYKGIMVRNAHASLSLWINENGAAAATQPSIEIRPYELFETPPNVPMMTETWNITGNSTQAFTARVW